MGAHPEPSSSSDNHHQPKPDEPSYHHHPNMYPPAGAIYPVTCPPQGYAPHPYAPYPYPDPHAYNNTNDFYYPQQHYSNLVAPEKRNSMSFGRVMLALMLCLIASMCLMTLVMWFLFGAYAPDFSISNVHISNFNVSDTNLSAAWNISIKISNANQNLALKFDPVISSLLYKDILIGVSPIKPFDVLQSQSNDLTFPIRTDQTQTQPTLQENILPELKKDFDNGQVVFSLKLATKVKFMTSDKEYRELNMRVACDKMHVVFNTKTGEGNLSPGAENTCTMHINERAKE